MGLRWLLIIESSNSRRASVLRRECNLFSNHKISLRTTWGTVSKHSSWCKVSVIIYNGAMQIYFKTSVLSHLQCLDVGLSYITLYLAVVTPYRVQDHYTVYRRHLFARLSKLRRLSARKIDGIVVGVRSSWFHSVLSIYVFHSHTFLGILHSYGWDHCRAELLADVDEVWSLSWLI